MARLGGIVGAMTGPVFAVVDGGHFEDISAGLSGIGLLSRSLFLGDAAHDVQRYGPWMAAVAGEHVDRLMALIGELPAVVFWSCSGGENILFAHLRRLNTARIPAWAAAGHSSKPDGDESGPGLETVTFRHWDPTVLGALMPLLDETQFSRIVGPADEIAYLRPTMAAHGGSWRTRSGRSRHRGC